MGGEYLANKLENIFIFIRETEWVCGGGKRKISQMMFLIVEIQLGADNVEVNTEVWMCEKGRVGRSVCILAWRRAC